MNEFYLYGTIGGWGVSAAMLAGFLKDNAKKDVTVRINSFGGSAYEGISMRNLLKAHKGHVTAHIDGACMSAATMAACGADHVVMHPGALYMVHDVAMSPWLEGSAEDIEKEAERVVNHLKKLREAAIDIYEARTSMTREEIRAAMDAETFYTGDEALLAGYIDEVSEVDAPENVLSSIEAQLHDPMLDANGKNTLRDLKEKFIYNRAQQKPAANFTKNEPVNLKPKEEVPEMDKDELIKAAKEEQRKAELKRREEIQMAFKDMPAATMELKNECLLNMDCTVEMAKDSLLKALAASATEAAKAPAMAQTTDAIITPSVQVEDQLEKNSGLILASWEARAQGKFDRENPMNNAGIHGAARMFLQNAGVNPTMMGDRELIDRALAIRTPQMAASPGQAITDFPMLLQEFVRRVAMNAYRLAPQTWRRFCTVVSLTDFRATEFFSHGISQTLTDKDSEGNYASRKLSDAEKGTVKASEKGAIYALKRSALINDDLGAIANQFNGIGSTAGRSIENAVYSFILSNPTLADGKKLFDKTRGNILDAAPMTAEAWEKAKLALANQKAVNTTGDKNSDEFLDLRPELLLTSVTNESKVRALNVATVIQSTGEAVPQSTNGMFTPDRVIATQRLDGKGSFYFAPRTDAQNITVGFVGSDEPAITMLEDFYSGDPQVRVQLDFGLGVQNYRGVVFAPHGEPVEPVEPEVKG